MLRVAIIGLGVVSKVHLPIIQNLQNSKLVAVCDVDDKYRGEIDNVNFYNDYNEMLDREDLDIVHICLPHYLHYQATRDSVEKGVNVFLEKPMSLNYKEAKNLLDLDKNTDKKICVCLQNRLNESVEKLMEIKEGGTFGKVTGVKGIVTWYRPEKYYEDQTWRKDLSKSGGGVMINQSIHTLDLMYYIAGRVDSIRGGIDNIIYDYEIEDTAYARIKFKNGARGLYFATIGNYENSSIELDIEFEKGKFLIKDCKLFEIKSNGGKRLVTEDSKLIGSKFYYGASHKKLIGNFHDSVRLNNDNYIHVQDGIESMKMIDAIKLSSRQKKEVKLEELE